MFNKKPKVILTEEEKEAKKAERKEKAKAIGKKVLKVGGCVAAFAVGGLLVLAAIGKSNSDDSDSNEASDSEGSSETSTDVE